MTNDLEKRIQDDEISLKELILKIKEWWQYLWSKKWIIIAAGIIGGLLGFGYSFIKKPIYTATTTFVLESGEKGGGLGAYAGVASMMGIDLGGGGGGIFQGDNILELYKSRKMIEKTLFSPVDTLSKQPLIERYLEINQVKEDWKDTPELSLLKFTIEDLDLPLKIKDEKLSRVRDSIVGNVVENINNNYLTVKKEEGKGGIIKVVIKSKDEIFSKRFNEEIVRNVNDFYIQTKTKKSLINVKILQSKTDSVQAVMNGAVYRAVATADATPNSNPTRQVQRMVPIQKAQFSVETSKAVLGEMMKNLEMSKLSLMKETPLIEILDGPKYPLLKNRLGKAKGLVIGGFLFGFLTVLFLIVRKLFKNILQ